MRTRKVDFKTYFSPEARNARALVKRPSMSRFNSVGEFDRMTEQEVEEQRRNYQEQRDERANQAALTKYVPADDLLEKARNGDANASRRLIRHNHSSPHAQAEALIALDEIKEQQHRANEEAWRAANPWAAAQEDAKARHEAQAQAARQIAADSARRAREKDAIEEIDRIPRYFIDAPRR